MIHIYGIKNCNTVKKTLQWLEDHAIDYTFHDFKKEPATSEKLEEWQTKTSWENLVNKRGTTWRNLHEEDKASVTDAPSSIKVLLGNNSMIKRPVIEANNKLILGFDEVALKTNLL